MAQTLKITEITVSLGATLNTGNFNNLRVDLTMKAQVPDDMTVEAATHKLSEIVRDALIHELHEVECDPKGFAAIDTFAMKAAR